MVLVFLGAAGSGKDTQAEVLEQEHGFMVVSSGQIFRDAIESHTPEGDELEKFVDSGNLVPDELVYKLLERYLRKVNITNLVLTGTVRTSPQVEMLDQVLANLGTKLDYALFFKLDDQHAIERISGRRYGPNGKMYHLVYDPPKVAGIDDETGQPLEHRDDDQPEAIAKRLQAFHANNDAVLHKYRQRQILIEIDAAPSIEVVAEAVRQSLNLG